MSRKIYNGYKIKTLNIKELDIFIKELRELVLEHFSEEIRKLYISKIINIVDNLCEYDYLIQKEDRKDEMQKTIEYYLKDIHTLYFSNIERELEKTFTKTKYKKEKEMNETIEKIEETLGFKYICSLNELAYNHTHNIMLKTDICSKCNKMYDFSTNIVFYPYNDEYMLVQIFGDRFTEFIAEFIESQKEKDIDFIKKYELEYYGYWTNWDKPKDMKEEEWVKREKDWEQVLPGYSIPNLSGISTSLFHIDTLMTHYQKRFLNEENGISTKYYIPKEERIEKYAKQRCKDKYILNKLEESGKTDNTRYSDVIKYSDEWIEKYENKDKDIMQSIKSIEKELNKIIIEITPEMHLLTVLDFLPNYKRIKEKEEENAKRQPLS